jgi:hypothetical protein
MRARHLWLVDTGEPSPLIDFLRECPSAYQRDDPDWSAKLFLRAARLSFDRVVIGEVCTIHQLGELTHLIERNQDDLPYAGNRLVIIAPIAPACDPAILARAGFTIQQNANAVRTGGSHATACS